MCIDNLKQCSYLKCSYLKMGSHGNALAISFFRRRARMSSRAYEFHYSIEKRCGKLGRYVSFNENHVLYCNMVLSTRAENPICAYALVGPAVMYQYKNHKDGNFLPRKLSLKDQENKNKKLINNSRSKNVDMIKSFPYRKSYVLKSIFSSNIIKCNCDKSKTQIINSLSTHCINVIFSHTDADVVGTLSIKNKNLCYQ